MKLSRSSTYSILKDVIKDATGRARKNISQDDKFDDDYHIDPGDLTATINDSFKPWGLSLNDTEVDACETVRTLVDLIFEQIQEV